MNISQINKLFEDTAYTRMGGSREELTCAEYLKAQCEQLSAEAYLEAFELNMADIKKAVLLADGREIACKGYFLAGCHDVEAPFYYMPNMDKASLAKCKGKIVMIDGYMNYWKYQDILENGAVGFITYDGNANYADEDIDQRELHSYISKGNKLPGVNINAKTAIELVKANIQTARIILEQEEYTGKSHNVILDLPGETEDYIVLTAHYDSTSLSEGAYDNMSGSIGLLAIAEKYIKTPHHYGLRFIWCGAEECGLLGSKAYVAAHEEELKHIVFNINLDMIGSIMGEFIARCTSEEKLVHFVEYFASMKGFGIQAKQGIYSSDSTPFADKGVPAISLARIASDNTATIHNSYDTAKVISASQIIKDIDFITSFTDAFVNASFCPVSREIPENMKEKLDIYLGRKRGEL